MATGALGWDGAAEVGDARVVLHGEVELSS
jgi:hypothetical protein